MFIDQLLNIPLRYSIEAALEVAAPYTSYVEGELIVSAALMASITQELIIAATNAELSAELVVPVPMYTDVAAELVIPAAMRMDVLAECEIDSPINNFDVLDVALVMVCPMLNAALPVQYAAAYVLLDGDTIELIEASVSVDEGQFGWTAQVQLARMEDYDRFTSEKTFSLVLGGETYALILDGKQKPRSSAVDKQAIVSGISTCARFAQPRAKTVTKTWTTNTSATALAAELFPGETLEWDILDWTIPAPRLAADNETPFDILARVVNAAGAVVECNKDGTLYVRYRYPVSIATYDGNTPDQVYTDADHNFSLNEGIQLAALVNKIRIMDVATVGFADVMEFIQSKTDPARGKLRVYPNPWRSEFSVVHTSLPIVSASLVGVRTEQQVETVEVLRGKGSTSKPIYTIDSFQFLYADLGGIVADTDAKEFATTSTTKFESLVKLTYTTRFFEYDAVAFDGASVQFLVREPDNV